jgi:hypothetical protein
MKIVSGGQTGVDRAALDAAIAVGIDHGGWCPRGRLAEDGCIPERYRLRETDSPDYPARTELNVLDSDATLILYRGWLSGGTELTFRLARGHRRPCLTIDLDWKPDPARAGDWLRTHGVAVLNVAGPRESQSPGVAALAWHFVVEMLKSSSQVRPEAS